MKDYEIYEKKAKENYKRNEQFMKEFESWLNQKGLVKKTIRKHLNNVSLYIDDYLNYYDATTMEEGIYHVSSFLGDWFIEKCAWSSRTSLKETAASIKKFYECMSEKGYVKEENYKLLCSVIKENMDEFLEQMDAYDNEIYNDIFL